MFKHVISRYYWKMFNISSHDDSSQQTFRSNYIRIKSVNAAISIGFLDITS